MGNKKRKHHARTELTSVFLPDAEPKETPWKKRRAQIRIEIAESSDHGKNVIRLDAVDAIDGFDYDLVRGKMAKILESIKGI